MKQLDKDLELFLQAVATQGDAEIRLTAIDNALHRYRAVKEIPHLAYRVLVQIASRCKWKFRYHFETAETLGFFAGTDGSNILRALRPLCAAGAIAVVDLPRKDGGHPILCFAILCNARDRADATVRDLYVDLYAEKALKPTRHHTDLTLDQVVTRAPMC